MTTVLWSGLGGAVLTVVGTLLGTVLGRRSAVEIAREERLAATLEATRTAYGAFLGALYPAVAYLRALPELKLRHKAWMRLARAVQGDVTYFGRTQRHVRDTLGDRPLLLADAVAYAYAQLQVRQLPPDLRSAADAAVKYVEQLGEATGDEAVKSEWPAIWSGLMAARQNLDHQIPVVERDTSGSPLPTGLTAVAGQDDPRSSHPPQRARAPRSISTES